jgi:hypothetical protein
MAEVVTVSDNSTASGASGGAHTASGPIIKKLINVTDEELRELNKNFSIEFKQCTACKLFKWFHHCHSKKCSRDDYHTQSKECKKTIS